MSTMDVNLTISLMRGQMGVVIEKAVNAAVETVLGEMIRVVSLKFEEFRREMTAKEKENENIRNMLEMSRCQMKTLRRYVNALTTKEDRQTLQNHRATLVQLEPGRLRTNMGPPRRISVTNVTPCVEVQNPVSKSVHITEPTWETRLASPKTQNMAKEPVPTDAGTSSENYSEEMHGPQQLRVGSVKGETSSATVTESEGLVAESSDPLWGQTPTASSEVEHTSTVDSNLHSMGNNSEVFNTTTPACRESPFKVKQEEGEVEIVQVKDEPVETANSEFLRIELCQQAADAGPGISLELPLTQQCPQISCSSITEPGFTGMDPSTCPRVTWKFKDFWTRRKDAESQLAMVGGQRQVRPWCKEMNLFEEYKRKRIEVRKRSETRRRELEQTLPQALLADLVKERREKTRLRVARWRAKRKLQACVMSQAAQLNGAPADGLFNQRGNRRRGPAVQQWGFGLGRASTSETGAYTLPLQIGSSPLLAAQRLSVAEGQIQPGATMFQQHRTPTAGSEMFQ